MFEISRDGTDTPILLFRLHVLISHNMNRECACFPHSTTSPRTSRGSVVHSAPLFFVLDILHLYTLCLLSSFYPALAYLTLFPKDNVCVDKINRKCCSLCKCANLATGGCMHWCCQRGAQVSH